MARFIQTQVREITTQTAPAATNAELKNRINELFNMLISGYEGDNMLQFSEAWQQIQILIEEKQLHVTNKLHQFIDDCNTILAFVRVPILLRKAEYAKNGNATQTRFAEFMLEISGIIDPLKNKLELLNKQHFFRCFSFLLTLAEDIQRYGKRPEPLTKLVAKEVYPDLIKIYVGWLQHIKTEIVLSEQASQHMLCRINNFTGEKRILQQLLPQNDIYQIRDYLLSAI